MDENKGPLSGKEPTAPQGPRRRAPHFYAGQRYGSARAKGSLGRRMNVVHNGKHVWRSRSKRQIRYARAMQYPDVVRYDNGAVPGIRDKGARRLIRAAFKKRLSSVEKGLRLAREMKAQAREVLSEQSAVKETGGWLGKSSRAAQRLFERELAIHTPVYVPTKKELRAMRTKARKLKRRQMKGSSVNDAIGAVVDWMSK